MNHKYNKFLEFSLLWVLLISLIGAVVYKLYSLNTIGVILSIILSLVSFIFIAKFYTPPRALCEKFYKKNQTLDKKAHYSIPFSILKIIYLLVLAFLFSLLIANSTSDSIISPWELIPITFFIFYILATILLITIASISKKSITYLISLHYLLSFSIAFIIYQIGYGFDPFVHRATLDIIDKVGEINPKPFYYLGQYSLTIILHKLSLIPIETIDKLLVPVLTAIYLPSTLINTLNKLFENKKIIKIATIILLILPFGFFIVTTPQNFAYLLLLLVIIRGLTCKNKYNLLIIYLLSLTALFTQLIAGIPALMFSVLITIYFSDFRKIKKYLYSIMFATLTLALPSAFFILNKINNSKTSAGANITSSNFFANFFSNSVPKQENVILNWLYLYGFNIKFLILLLVITGIIIAVKNKKECKIFSLYLGTALALFISFTLTTLLPFSFLISYERSNYNDRILNIGIMFLLPFIILSIFSFLSRLDIQNKFIKYSFVLFFSLLITASLYFSYPRLDNYHNSHGYSVGQSDIEAVTWIENNTKDDFIVLTNQQVSAAALYKYGFKKYYNNNIFYYPVPTGGKLYQYYLDMVYKTPNKKTIKKAMDLAGVNNAYFVLNKYWWASTKIAKEAKLEADSWQEFNNEEILIFKFTR